MWHIRRYPCLFIPLIMAEGLLTNCNQEEEEQQQQGQATKSRQGTLALDDKVVVGKGTKVVVAAKKTKAAKDPKSAVPGRQKGIAMSGLRRS